MSDALTENPEGLPEREARPPIVPPVEGAAPAPRDSIDHPLPLKSEKEQRTSGFTVQQGGRSGMTETAERIGNAVGMAQRQVRRGLQLVRRPSETQIAAGTLEADERATQLAREGIERASQMMESIEKEVFDARRQAAYRLDEWSRVVGERFQRFRRKAQRTLARSRARAEQIGNAYPLQTIAVTAGACLVLGVVLRFRRSRRG